MVFLVMTPCSFVGRYWRLGKTCYFHFQGWRNRSEMTPKSLRGNGTDCTVSSPFRHPLQILVYHSVLSPDQTQHNWLFSEDKIYTCRKMQSVLLVQWRASFSFSWLDHKQQTSNLSLLRSVVPSWFDVSLPSLQSYHQSCTSRMLAPLQLRGLLQR